MSHLLEIIKVPDKKLYKKAQNINEFDEKLSNLAHNMILTMKNNNGCGLASIQVLDDINFNQLQETEIYRAQPNIIIMLLNNKEVIAVNPKILSFSDETNMYEEGCLSVPNAEGYIKRSSSIQVQYQDLTGQIIKEELKNFNARVFQHEYDHNQGIIFPNRLNKLEELLFWKKYQY